MLSNQLFSFGSNINVDASFGVALINLPCLLRQKSGLTQKCGYFFARRAATRGATASQRVMVINIAMT